MYYLLETNYFAEPPPYRTRAVNAEFRYEPSRWKTGKKMVLPDEPVRIELWERGGTGLAAVFLDSIPLFRNDVVEALYSAGVQNLQACSAILKPEGDKAEVPGYSAVNIVGLVSAADMTKSKYDDITGIGIIAVGFRKLVIDEKLAGGHLLFRLAQAVTAIIVHEKVKTALDKKEFKYLSFRPLVE